MYGVHYCMEANPGSTQDELKNSRCAEEDAENVVSAQNLHWMEAMIMEYA